MARITPQQRRTSGSTTDVVIAGMSGVLSTGYGPDGALCRVDLRAGVHGSQLAGLAEALAVAITVGLQHGAPPAEYAAVLGLALDPSPDSAEEYRRLRPAAGADA